MQPAGRAHLFRDYRLRVAEVVRDYGMSERGQAPANLKAETNAALLASGRRRHVRSAREPCRGDDCQDSTAMNVPICHGLIRRKVNDSPAQLCLR
jgi:hypothetical protein